MRQPHASNCGVALERRKDEQHTGRQQVAQRHPRLRPRGPEAALVVLAVLGGHQDGAAPLAADREALHQPADQEQDRRAEADGGVRRQQADREGGGTHHHQGDDEHLLAADPVTEVSEDHTTERPGDEAQRVGAEGQKRGGHRLRLGEEQLAEHQGGGRPVEEEVVPLDGGADQAGEHHLDDAVGGGRRSRRAGRGGLGLRGHGVVSFHAAVQPPSMRNELPVTESVPGPHRKPTRSATSVGSTSRFTGVLASRTSSRTSSSSIPWVRAWSWS